MSFETRMEQLDADITTLESAVPFVLTQEFPPNQRDWEIRWLGEGNNLPIPSVQELYWQDSFALRGEYKTLPDKFSLLARSLATGFQIRDIAGWEDDDHLIVFVVRDDPNAPQGCCRLYMDGTLEQIIITTSTLTFNPTGLLGYDRGNDYLYYYETLDVKRVHIATTTIVPLFTAVSGGLPEWRFFIFANTAGADVGDIMFGARIGADAARSLYFLDYSASLISKVMTTFNPGGGAVIPDRPLAFTQNYVFLSEIDTRAAFDGNLIHQITRSGYTWQVQVNHGTFSAEVRVIVSDTDFANNTIDVVVGHLTSAVLTSDWNFTTLWTAATQTATTTTNQPHNTMLQILRQNVNDHDLAYHIDTRLYYDPAFVADGGSEVHYNNVGALLLNSSGDKYLIHDLGWHTWTISDAPDLYLFGESTNKIYRISDWSQFDDDVILVTDGTLSDGISSLDISSVPLDYGLFELIHEMYTSAAAGTGIPFNGDVGGIINSNALGGFGMQSLASTGEVLSELSTNASLRHYFIPRYKLSSNYEISYLARQSVRTAFSAWVHQFLDGITLNNLESEITSIPLSQSSAASGNRYIVRAWRTVPRMKANGSEYDPSMA